MKLRSHQAWGHKDLGPWEAETLRSQSKRDAPFGDLFALTSERNRPDWAALSKFRPYESLALSGTF